MLRGFMVDPRKLALRLIIAQQRFELIDNGEDAIRLAIRSRSIGHIYIEGEVRPHRGMYPGEELLLMRRLLALCNRNESEQRQKSRRDHRPSATPTHWVPRPMHRAGWDTAIVRTPHTMADLPTR